MDMNAEGQGAEAGAEVSLPFDRPTSVRARVLRATDIAGSPFSADAVVELELELAKRLWEQGVVDPDPAAVAYAESLAAEGAAPTPGAGA
jgi:hypothetical protein